MRVGEGYSADADKCSRWCGAIDKPWMAAITRGDGIHIVSPAGVVDLLCSRSRGEESLYRWMICSNPPANSRHQLSPSSHQILHHHSHHHQPPHYHHRHHHQYHNIVTSSFDINININISISISISISITITITIHCDVTIAKVLCKFSCNCRFPASFVSHLHTADDDTTEVNDDVKLRLRNRYVNGKW